MKRVRADEGDEGVRAVVECPYLDSVCRSRLDLDFEARCSVTLSPLNVYCCLVCGRFFQGRGPATVAYTHSLEASHHVFLALASGRVFCLPDGYEVLDRSLDDIRHVLKPRFGCDAVRALDRGPAVWSRSLDGREYLPGLVGLNNLKASDYAAVVVQALMRVRPLRDALLTGGGGAPEPLLLSRLGELARKLWNPRAFKGHVSPHQFLQAVATASGGRFTADRSADPVDFLAWLLNTLRRCAARAAPLAHLAPRLRHPFPLPPPRTAATLATPSQTWWTPASGASSAWSRCARAGGRGGRRSSAPRSSCWAWSCRRRLCLLTRWRRTSCPRRPWPACWPSSTGCGRARRRGGGGAGTRWCRRRDTWCCT